MIASKHITKFVAVVVAAAVVLCLAAMAFPDELAEAFGGAGILQEYESKLFDTGQIISIEIRMDSDDWQDMLDNAINEAYYQCDVVVNGTTFYRVGIRPKGNTSLSAIAMDTDNDRYSFKLEFDRFVDGQTCWGLDKLILNNNYADATNMKEAVVYDMYQYLDADASLYNYAKISVNGSYWGIYLALEAVEDSFLLRNYGVESGELYKPDSLNIGGGQGGDVQPAALPDTGNLPEELTGGAAFGGEGGKSPDMSDFDFSSFGGMGGMDGMGGVFGQSGGGADLNYIDDELDSYSAIWDGTVTTTSNSDHRRVVTALKKVSEGTELETYLDVDNILKYMAVHSFAVNEDSLSGSMAHNYYLYEHDGQLNILPWDYNLSFGGMSGMGQSSGADGVVNDPIDTPFAGTKFFDSLLENEEYLARYHEYYAQLIEEYVLGGGFDEAYDRIRGQIDSLVKTDPNAMYSYEEYEAAAQMLYDTVMLRAESVQGQLDGSIPSTTEGQRADSGALIDASAIDIETMGVFSMGGFGGETGAFSLQGEMPDGGSFDSSNLPADFDPSQFGGNFSGIMPASGGTASTGTLQNAVWYAGCFVLLLLALLFAKQYRRRPRRPRL